MPDTPDLDKKTPGTAFLSVPGGERANAETRLSRLSGYLTPIDAFYVRNHSPTPTIDAASWRLRLEGDGLERAVTLSLGDLQTLPRTTRIRAIECAGNARTFFERDYGRLAGNAQWQRGAIGVAEWTGVRLADVLAVAGLRSDAVDVLPEGLDADRFSRPLPVDKALADDTLIALSMNGEPLPADHGFPARLVVGGWLGAASVKWLGRIEVARRRLYTHWNTRDYTLAGPDYPAQAPADGIPVTVMPVMSFIELDWPARLPAGPTRLHGRAFSGEGRVVQVAVSIDDGPWQDATLGDINQPAAWVCWSLPWQPEPGHHNIRVRATDEKGQTQPDSVPWNDHGVLYNAVLAHPVEVV
ncbi:sulfite oxidase [uncultured Salinisphaera sp.]|uniref:sulfite oxidase n=1 Tax=uncultured Salinisphaera sp. TaxID=359372 RepID=UPI0032B24828|tara:strand:- start:4692 stop:5759 length:1068 start_codon:yes stop_codon:yes gene_type:complete